MAMVMRANDNEDALGGHISSFSSSATLYDIGFNYFFHGPEGRESDMVFFQGISPRGSTPVPTWKAFDRRAAGQFPA